MESEFELLRDSDLTFESVFESEADSVYDQDVVLLGDKRGDAVRVGSADVVRDRENVRDPSFERLLREREAVLVNDSCCEFVTVAVFEALSEYVVVVVKVSVKLAIIGELLSVIVTVDVVDLESSS